MDLKFCHLFILFHDFLSGEHITNVYFSVAKSNNYSN